MPFLEEMEHLEMELHLLQQEKYLLQHSKHKIWETSESLLKYGPMIYKTYLKTEHNDENIEFWLACKAYKKITSQRRRIFMARKLFRSYIHPQAPSEINIDSPARKATVRNSQEPTQSCLDEAQRIIYRHIERDPYLQFLESQLYQKLKHSLQSDGNNSTGNCGKWLET